MHQIVEITHVLQMNLLIYSFICEYVSIVKLKFSRMDLLNLKKTTESQFKLIIFVRLKLMIIMNFNKTHCFTFTVLPHFLTHKFHSWKNRKVDSLYIFAEVVFRIVFKFGLGPRYFFHFFSRYVCTFNPCYFLHFILFFFLYIFFLLFYVISTELKYKNLSIFN